LTGSRILDPRRISTKKILVAYATHAGSTVEVAKAVGEEISKSGIQVDILPIAQVGPINSYDGVVLGGPMIMGWHRSALRFLRKHRKAFQSVPLAVFVMAMSLTRTGETSVNGVPVQVDENLPKPPAREGRLNFKERYARVSSYARPILRAVRPARPLNIAFFGGRLDYGRLKWWAVLFAMVIIQAPAGERRNWTAIRAWAAGLPEAFQRAG
jgi:menaquinone-dependent protoporphyrinogen oxidase